jgi:Leucine-rich repeat (LRR) protein
MLMNKNFDQLPAVARLGGAINIRMKNAFLIILLVAVAFCTATAQPVAKDDHPLLNTTQLDNQRWYYDLDSALANPDNVYKLSLIDQKIKTLPEDFGKLRNLQILNLSNCKLKALPLEIKDCKNLTMISLYGNKLKFLPAEMRELKNLEILYLGNNKLFELPQWFGTMTKMRRLDVSRNPLTPADVSNAKRMLPKADVTF